MGNTRVFKCLAALGVSLLTACLVSMGLLSNGLDVFWLWGDSAPHLPGGIAGAHVPDQFKIRQAEQQQQRQQQAFAAGTTSKPDRQHVQQQQHVRASTSASRHESGCAPAGESRDSGPVYYQQGLAQSLLSVPQPVISPYSPNLLYYSINADGYMLRQYLKRAGMPVPPKDIFRFGAKTCMEIAQSMPEPFHNSMLVRGRKVPEPISGAAPLAQWRWDSGKITRAHFEETPKDLRTPNGGPCAQCVTTQKYKVLNGRLYGANSNDRDWAIRAAEDLLTLVIHLYNIPDMDFILHLGDGAVKGHPILAVNINRDDPHAGFTFPYVDSYMWQGLSLQQAVVLADCSRIRHPRETAVPRAVWRGSTSDPLINAIELSNIAGTSRFKLHVLSDIHPDVLDARITKVIQTPDQYNACKGDGTDICQHQSKALAALLGQPSPEGGRWLFSYDDLQHFALLLDVDGNSWSSRLFQLLTYSATPIIKQASPLQTWYEHLFAPDGSHGIALFAHNLSDLPQRSLQLLKGMGYEPEVYHAKHGLGALTSLDTTLMRPRREAPAKPRELSKGPKQQLGEASERVTEKVSQGNSDPVSASNEEDVSCSKKNSGQSQDRSLMQDSRIGVAHADGHELLDSIQNMNDVAAILLNRWGMVEAVAFSLKAYADLCDWKTEPEQGYTLLAYNQQQQSLPWLPRQLKNSIIKEQLLDTARMFTMGRRH